jgi:TBC1 domain family member 20
MEVKTGADPVNAKQENIRRACTGRDLDALITYATSEGGLLHDDLRRAACMLLFKDPRYLQVL